MDIEIRNGLAEARALAVEHSGALTAYVALGVVVPYLLLSSEPIFDLRTVIALIASPYSSHISGSIAGPLYLLGIVVVIAAGAMLAAWNAILPEMREGYVSEIMYGMVAGVAFLIGNIIVYFGLGLLATLPLFLFAQNMLLGGGGPAFAIAIESYRILLSLLATWLGARLCLTGAIMGANGKLEPFSAFAESWRLTGAAQWRLFAFYFLFGLIVAAAFGGLVLLHAAVIWDNAQAPGSWLETAMSFGWILLFALYFLGQILIPAGLYRASEPETTASEVFA
ncbi:hypothetical protein [Sphingopyxis sp.]|uniref:hypothetical protein n=1 Tax=Sphingopyxis sp. TaxID=1908224 RepID=UPI002600D68B|nr:hypothetical protein [Sphingopyxis sp.]MBK6412234.1 hypothetical protein [Sphingopyxis sp.]